jgi:hypothetical protein
MPYTINKTNGTVVSTVQDGTIDAKSIDLTLVGKNYSGYGEIFNENFVKLLENFSNSTPPSSHPLIGQIWFDSNKRKLKVNTGVGDYPWKSVGVIENGNSKPAGYNAGDLWWKTDEGRLYAYTGAGTTWTLVGPVTSKTGFSGALESTVTNASLGSDTVIKLVVNGNEAAIVSDIDNTLNSGTKNTDPSYALFPYIKKGITLPAYTVGATDGVSYRLGDGYILWGTAASALSLVDVSGTQHYADEYLLKANLASLNSSIRVGNDNGITVGIQGVGEFHITDSTIANLTNVSGAALRFNLGTRDSTSTQSGDFYNIFYITTGTDNSSYILPNSTATVYLGTATQTFSYLYVNTATFTTVTSVNIAGTTIKDSGNRVITSFTLNVGNGISGGGTVTGPNGTLAFTNTGILSVTGTTNQVSITAGQNPTFSLPQDIGTSSDVTFNKVTAGSLYDNTSRVLTAATIATNAVTTLTGTANQISVSANQGAVTLSLPQNINTGASPTFNELTLTNLRATTANGTGSKVYGTWTLAAGATFQATFADLAERYAADADYAAGTVLVIGGNQEVTVTTQRADTAKAGIVSTNPAYTLNAGAGNDSTHPYIALAGRVPCMVIGPIEKGDLLVTSSRPGFAESAQDGDSPTAVLGRALASFDGEEGVIEVKVV